jgi:hypothetical protein
VSQSSVAMEFLLNACYYVTLFLIPIAFYSLLFKHKTENRFFTNRGKKRGLSIANRIFPVSDWFYLVKLIFARPAIKKYQKKCRNSLDEATKKSLENPKEITSDIVKQSSFDVIARPTRVYFSTTTTTTSTVWTRKATVCR